MPSRIPLWAKITYSAFVAVLVPVYWQSYGPTNFLYFCDVALLMTVAAMWLESPLLASMPSVGILLPQALWMLDFLLLCVGIEMTGMTGYMFDPKIKLFTRFLSFFHFWLPILLVWLVWRLGYERRALKHWSLLALVLMVVCFFFMPKERGPNDPENLPVNINYVFGLKAPQQTMSEWAYFGLVLILLPLGIYAPTHWTLARLFPAPADRTSSKLPSN